MKKLLATLLALSMVVCFAVTASAVEITDVTTNNEATQQISIKLNDATSGGGTTTPTVYMVDVEWTATELVYTLSGEGSGNTITWNPQEHKYELTAGEGGTIDGSWTTGSFNITVTNHSNADICATITLPEDQNGVSFSANKATFNVDRADVGESLGDESAAPSDFFTVTADGIPNGDFTVDTKVTITAVP